MSPGTGGGRWPDSLINLISSALRNSTTFRRLQCLLGMVLISVVLVIATIAVVVIVRGDDLARILVSWIGQKPGAPN